MNKNSCTGLTCLVTGASRGIGKAIALELADNGASIIVHYHKNKDVAENLLISLPGSGHSTIQADLSDMNQVHKLYETLKDRRIDVLINNAGVYIEKPALEMDSEEWNYVWNQTIALNLTAPALLAYLFSQKMIRQGGGRIINITSRGAFRGEPNALAYGASKAGLNSYSQSLAQSLAPHNILVFTVAPGFVDTDMAQEALYGHRGEEIKKQSPLHRAAKPDEIANLVRYLACDAPEYLIGSIIDVNGASYLRN